MEQLWAPWRMELIAKAGAQNGCIFCDLPRAKNDRENLILGRTPHTFAILNRYPYNNGHLMVVPRSHSGDLVSLPREEHEELAEMVRVAMRLVGQAYRAQGYNLGMNLGSAAGAGIAGHVHWHVVPRWTGDTNFMSVVGNVRVLPEELGETARRLRPIFERLAKDDA